MNRTAAVRRINDGIGFRPDGHSLEPTIILRLQEAQRDLEHGKTLPRFLIREDQTLTLLAGAHIATLPTDFIREDDDNRLHYVSPGSHLFRYLTPARYTDAVIRVMTLQRPDQPNINTLAPSVYVIRKTDIDFISLADQDYTLTWNYYGSGAILTTDIENEWLAEVPEWLIGEAGIRVARDLRDQDALQLFSEMAQKARAAVFSDIIADEDAMGPVVMGSYL